MSVPEQLSLDLPWRPALGRDDFMVAPCNVAAVALIDAWPAWPGPVVCLHGPVGAGKTHLAHVFAARAQARTLRREELAGADPLAPFPHPGVALVLEDVDQPGLTRAVETDLFHLINAARQTQASVLFTASQMPSRWPVGLPDLRSRLAAVPEAGLGEPDDAVLMAVLLKQFADRGLDVGPGAISFLLPRLERRFAAIQDLVRRADALALREGKAITIPLLRRVLAELQG
ncbi:HdaA/DnaA family protein [Pararhodospirillum photometricum]|uniref:Regulatory inactivation of DnaA Hda protein n=1 Tax=Pararhodospirillum photometricum DSM 122 TaxID=1150469 RepID=H6SJP0_PARPM|nr:Regulatory inactivation of DnaA Hda protein [Pararhodospirillum photometricum]CCG08205.1 Regulatory inactivation of DnaA Hda protein [Pararhodospirillum photometricum DSM 122]